MADSNDVPLALSPQLRAAIAGDLRPVTPLPPPIVRAAWVAPLGVVLLFAAALVFGVRRDFVRLGFALTWGASAAETMLGLVLIVAALREAIPGTTLSRRAIGSTFAAAMASVAIITVITWWTSPISVMRGREVYIAWLCFAGTLLSAVPPLAVSAWLVRRAFPLRPALAGALYGLGSGLLADAGWRIFCHFSDPAHVFPAHLLAVIVATGLGALVASHLRAR
jgi:hypothetical protein